MNSKFPPISCYIFSLHIPRNSTRRKICGTRIREKIFKNYALKSMEDVYAKLEEAALYIERNPSIVKSITSFPYIAKSI
jgi:hypothetical protein